PRPPATDLRLWLRADEGVATSDGTSVTTWEDQAGGILNNGTPAGSGVAQLVTANNFPSGSHPVVRLDGSSGLALDNVYDLDTPTLSIYVVASVDNTLAGGTFLANLRQPFGFALGISDATPGRVTFYT